MHFFIFSSIAVVRNALLLLQFQPRSFCCRNCWCPHMCLLYVVCCLSWGCLLFFANHPSSRAPARIIRYIHEPCLLPAAYHFGYSTYETTLHVLCESTCVCCDQFSISNALWRLRRQSRTQLLSRNKFYHHNNMPLQDLYLPSRTREIFLPNHAQESQTWSPSSSIPLQSHMKLLAEEGNLRMLLGRCSTEQDHETVVWNNWINQLSMRVRKAPSPIPDASSLEPSSKDASGTAVRLSFPQQHYLGWKKFCFEMDATNSGTNPSARYSWRSSEPTSSSSTELTPKYESIQGRTSDGLSVLFA